MGRRGKRPPRGPRSLLLGPLRPTPSSKPSPELPLLLPPSGISLPGHVEVGVEGTQLGPWGAPSHPLQVPGAPYLRYPVCAHPPCTDTHSPAPQTPTEVYPQGASHGARAARLTDGDVPKCHRPRCVQTVCRLRPVWPQAYLQIPPLTTPQPPELRGSVWAQQGGNPT